MAIIKRVLSVSTNNESLPAVIDELTEVAIAKDFVTAWFNPARAALLKGLTPAGQPDSAFLARDSGLFGRPGAPNGVAAAGARIIGAKRPNIVFDAPSGKNWFQFGYGAGLSAAQSGALATQKLVSLTAPTGWAIFGAFKVPTPGGGNPATTGGWILGNGNAGFNNPTALRVDPANGNVWFTPYGFPGTGYLIDNSKDYRDGLAHRFMVAYNALGGVLTLYVDEAEKASASGVAPPSLIETGYQWGIGSMKSDEIYQGFVGLLGDIQFSAIPFNSPAWASQRGVIQSYLAGKWHN